MRDGGGGFRPGDPPPQPRGAPSPTHRLRPRWAGGVVAVGAVGVLSSPLLLAVLAGPPTAPLFGQGEGEEPPVPLLGVAVGGKPSPVWEVGGERWGGHSWEGGGGTVGAHLGGGQWTWGGLGRQGDEPGGAAGGCGSAGGAGGSEPGGSFLGGLFSFGASRRELAFSSATSTSKSLARPCTSRRWCTEWICGVRGGGSHHEGPPHASPFRWETPPQTPASRGAKPHRHAAPGAPQDGCTVLPCR